MPIFVKNQAIDLSVIKRPDNKWYEGEDEIFKIIRDVWKELESRFWSKGEPVVFHCPKVKSGNQRGHMGFGIPRVVDERTRRSGMVRIAWADTMKTENGKTVYDPVSRIITMNDKTLYLTQDDVEEAIWLMRFNPFLKTDSNPDGEMVLIDNEKIAEKYEQEEQEGSIIPYWLFNKISPLYTDENRIGTLCLAWGINPENKSLALRKKLLAEEIKKYERAGNAEFGIKSFDSICRRLLDGNDIRDVETMALIQKCVVNKVIRFDDKKFAWVLLGIEGNEIKILCKVPPQSAAKARDFIKRSLIQNPEDVELLNNALYGPDVRISRHDTALLNKSLPDVITREYIENELYWPDAKIIYGFLGNKITPGLKQETVIPVLTEYFIVQQKTIPWKVKEGKE